MSKKSGKGLNFMDSVICFAVFFNFNDFYSKFNEESMENDSFFLKKENDSFNFDLRGFVIKKFKDCGVSQIDNINLDSFATKSEYFSHRRAKKLEENDYGRCISVIRKISSQN